MTESKQKKTGGALFCYLQHMRLIYSA